MLVRLARDGVVDRLRHGVYRIAGAPIRPHQDVHAAWLAIEPRSTARVRLSAPNVAVVSHRSAALLHGLGDIDADVAEFTLPQRKQSRQLDVRYHRGAIRPDQWTLLDGLPVTTIVTTVGDLAAGHLDGGHLASVVRDAVTSGHTDPDAVATVLRPYAHRYGAPLGNGRALLTRLLTEAGVPNNARTLAQFIDPGHEPAHLFTPRRITMHDRHADTK